MVVQLKTELDTLKRRMGLDEPQTREPDDDEPFPPGHPGSPPTNESNKMVDNEPLPPGSQQGPPPPDMSGEMPLGHLAAQKGSLLQTTSPILWLGYCSSCRHDMKRYTVHRVNCDFFGTGKTCSPGAYGYGAFCGGKFDGYSKSQWVYLCGQTR